MRRWHHFPPGEPAANPYDHEWASSRVRGQRRRAFNFEQAAEPHAGSPSPPAPRGGTGTLE